MATSSDPIIGIVTQGDSPLLSRAVTINIGGVETVVTQSMLDTISYRVYDYQTGEVTVTPVSLTISAVIDDTPPTSGLLDGMNFSFQLDGSLYLVEGLRRRKVQVTFTLTGGETFTRSWILWTENIFDRTAAFLDITPPTAPSNLIADAASATAIELSWDAATDAIGVTIYSVEMNSGSGFAEIATVGSPTTAYSATGLSDGITYLFRVRAGDLAGNLSSYSNTASAAVLFLPSELSGVSYWEAGQGAAAADGQTETNATDLGAGTHPLSALGTGPTYHTNKTPTGRGAWTCGAGFGLQNTSLAMPRSALAGWIVYRPNNSTETGVLWALGSNNFFIWEPPLRTWDGSTGYISDRLAVANLFSVMTYDSSGQTVRVNSMPNVASLAPMPSATLTGYALGCETDGSVPLIGEIAGGGIHTPTTTADIESLERYLYARFIWPAASDAKVVLIEGNSLSNGYGLVDVTAPWPTQMQGLLGGTWAVRNFSAPSVLTSELAASARIRIHPASGGSAKNIVVAWEATNSLTGAISAATTYGQVGAWCQGYTNTGRTVILLDCLPRQDVDIETPRLAYNASLAADFTVATANPRVFGAGPGVTYAQYLVKVSAIANLSDPANATYYQADKVHLTKAGAALIAADVKDAVLLV